MQEHPLRTEGAIDSLGMSVLESLKGAVAQLGARVTGSHEVAGSNPASSTNSISKAIQSIPFSNLLSDS